MQSFQVIEQLEALRDMLKSEENDSFMNWLAMLAESRSTLKQPMANALNINSVGSDKAGIFYEGYRKIIISLHGNIKSFKPNFVFYSIIRLREAFNVLKGKLEENPEVCLSYTDSIIREFENDYVEFIQDYSYYSTVKLIYSGTSLYYSIRSIDDFCDLTLQNLQNNYEHDSSLASLSLLLESTYTYKDFVRKLEALQNLYSELCSLMNISESDFPLRIVKVESGSLFVKIFGEPKVIEMISSLIKDMTSFLYRNKTTEGKVESIPRKAEAIESILQLRKKLQEEGIEVDGLDERLEKSAIILAEELNCLLTDESKIKLNGEILQAGNSKKQKLLGRGQRYLLEGTKDITEEIDF